MEEKQQKSQELGDQETEHPYTPRPAWQLWAARIGLVIFILLVIAQILHMIGGLR